MQRMCQDRRRSAKPSHPMRRQDTEASMCRDHRRRRCRRSIVPIAISVIAADAGSGRTDVVVYPWDVSLARQAPDDSALNHLRDEIVSLTPLGNRARVRLKLLTAEVTTASIERLGLRPGDTVVASFKATQARLLSRH